MKRGKVKQILALTLTVALLGALAGGCAGKKDESGQPDAKEAETMGEAQASGENGEAVSEKDLYMIDVMPNSPAQDSSLDTAVGRELAERFGIGFHYIEYNGDMQEKQAAMLAGGDYNEIQCMEKTAISDQYIKAGVLLDLDDYKDLLPDFYERFKDIIPYWRLLSRDGGLHLWQAPVPNDYLSTMSHYNIAVRTDVLEYYGWPNLVTASDWIEFLKKAVKDFPETYDGTPTVGLTLPGAESYGMNLLAAPNEEGDMYAVDIGGVNWVYNLKTEQFEDAWHTAEKKECLKFFHDLYQEGVLDPEMFTDTIDMTVEKMSNGSAIAVWYVKWNSKDANQKLAAAGHPEMSYIEQPFQLDSQEGQKFVAAALYTYPHNQWGVTDKCKDPEKFFQLLNWCCTEEGQLLLQNGIEGVHYEMQNGERVPTEFYGEMIRDVALLGSEGLPGGPGSELYPLKLFPYCVTTSEDGRPYNLGLEQEYADKFALSDREKEAFQGLGWNSSQQWWMDHGELVDVTIVSSCELDRTSDLGKIEEKLNEVYQKYAGQIVIADDFEKAFADMMAEYEKLDYQSVINARNTLLKENKEELAEAMK